MPSYSSVSYHDINTDECALEHQAASSWRTDVARMKFTPSGTLSFVIDECKMPTGTYVKRVITTGDYERS